MFIFSEFDSISKAEVSEMIEAKTKTIEAKTKTIEAKCLSEAEIIKLIDSKLLETKTNCPISEPGYVTVNNKCIYFESLNMSHTNFHTLPNSNPPLLQPRKKGLWSSNAVIIFKKHQINA